MSREHERTERVKQIVCTERDHLPRTFDEILDRLEGDKADQTYTDISLAAFRFIQELDDASVMSRGTEIIQFAAACYALGRKDERERGRS